MDVGLGTRLRVVISKPARPLTEPTPDEGVTPPQSSVWRLIRSQGPLGLAELASLEGLNPTMLSRVVRALDEAGLIRRLPNPSDLRAPRVEITPAGSTVHGRIRDHRTQVLTKCLEQLPPETTEALLSSVPAMEALVETVKALPRTPA